MALEKGKSCGNCRFYDAVPAGNIAAAVDPAAPQAPAASSTCRYQPPTPTPDGKSSVWPVVAASDWCGEWTGGQG